MAAISTFKDFRCFVNVKEYVLFLVLIAFLLCSAAVHKPLPCYSNSDCPFFNCCRIEDKECYQNCKDGYCSSYLDCGWFEDCCSGQCTRPRTNCLGHSCDTDSDCGRKSLRCCQGLCLEEEDYHCHDHSTAIVLASVFGTIGFLVVIIILYIYCARRRILVVTCPSSRSRDETDSVTQEPLDPRQDAPPYLGQDPPSYQQAIIAPPDHPESTRVSDAPPPYSAAREGRSGDLYPSYGAAIKQ